MLEAPAPKRKSLLIAFILFAVTLAILVLTLNDIGITIDEPYRNRVAAKRFVGWLIAAIREIQAGQWGSFSSPQVIDQVFKFPYSYHPPFARFLAGITWQLFHGILGEMASLRLAPALLFSLSIAFLFRLISKHYDRLSALIAALSLFLIPATFGHAHLLALDSPIASMWFLAVFFFLKGLTSPVWSLVWGVVWALSLNTKIHAYFLPVPLFLWAFLFHRQRSSNNFFAMLFISPVVLFFTNPYLWPAPVERLLAFLADMSSKVEYEKIPTYFIGKIYKTATPWFYPFFMVAVTIPIPILLLSALGILRSLISDLRRINRQCQNFPLGYLFILNALAALGLASMKGIPTYDGVRLFLPAYPFIAGLAGIGFFQLRRWLQKIFNSSKVRKQILGSTLAIILVPTAYSLINIHPFELSYFNSLIGGPKGAKELGLESTYWNDAFNGEVTKYINENFPGKVFSSQPGIRVNFDYYRETGQLREDIGYDPKKYDYYLLYFRQGWFDSEDWFYARFMEPIYQVMVDDVPLLAIYQRLSSTVRDFYRIQVQNKIAGFALDEEVSYTTMAYEQDIEVRDTVNEEQAVGKEMSLPVKRSWEGLLKVPEDGQYLLSVLVLGNFDLKLDDNTIFQVSSPNTVRLYDKKVRLSEGFKAIKGEFSSHQPEGKLYLAWITTKGDKSLLPVLMIGETE